MNWFNSPEHLAFLERHGRELLDFAARAADPQGGFTRLSNEGRRIDDFPLELWINARMTHIFALGSLLGYPGCGALADHGVAALRDLFRDREYGGWYATVRHDGPVDDSKQAYAHAFVVLAASSATAAGREGASGLLDGALQVLDTRFFEPGAGLYADRWSRDFSALDAYRGVNANMHAVEALLAAADVTGEPVWLQRAAGIVERVIDGFARDNGWRIPEHFTSSWAPLLEHNRDNPADPFQPYGATVGHGLEWARLTLSTKVALENARLRVPDWMTEAARGLFDVAVSDGWHADGAPGFVYTTDWQGRPVVHERMHWVVAEALGAAYALWQQTGDATYAAWYRTWWEYADACLIDHDEGSWHHELSAVNVRSFKVWPDKADAYHAVQATLIPRLPLAPVMSVCARDGIRRTL